MEIKQAKKADETHFLFGSINKRVSIDALKDYFSQFGHVERVYQSWDRDIKISRGMFAIFISGLVHLKIDELLSRKDKIEGDLGNFSLFYKKQSRVNLVECLQIVGIPKSIGIGELEAHFQKFGELKDILLTPQPDSQVAFVFFYSPHESCQLAISSEIPKILGSSLKAYVATFSQDEIMNLYQTKKESGLLSLKPLLKTQIEDFKTTVRKENPENYKGYENLQSIGNSLVISINRLPARTKFNFRFMEKGVWLEERTRYFKFLKFGYRYQFKLKNGIQEVVLRSTEKFGPIFECLQNNNSLISSSKKPRVNQKRPLFEEIKNSIMEAEKKKVQ